MLSVMAPMLQKSFQAFIFQQRQLPFSTVWHLGFRRTVSKITTNDFAKPRRKRDSSLTNRSNIKPSQQSFPDEDGVPGIRLQDFKSIFLKPDVQTTKEYPIRWDWHARMFLYSLVPVGLFWLFTLYIDYFMAADPEIKELLIDNRGFKGQAKKNTLTLEDLKTSFDKRMSDLETQLENMKVQLKEDSNDGLKRVTLHEEVPVDVLTENSIVEKARQWSRQMSRTRMSDDESMQD